MRRERVKAPKPRLQLEAMPLELVFNEDISGPDDESTYRHCVSTARAVATFGFLAHAKLSFVMRSIVMSAVVLPGTSWSQRHSISAAACDRRATQARHWLWEPYLWWSVGLLLSWYSAEQHDISA